MNVFNPIYFNSAWTYLTNGNPPPILVFAIANAALLLLFIFFRARKSKVDYRRSKKQLQALTVLANTAILFGDSFMTTMQHAFQPLKGMLNYL
jgi:hypothetical protein